MRWRGRRESENVEDRRGQGTGFGLPVNLPLGRGGLGLGGIVALVVISLLLGINPLDLLQQVADPASVQVQGPGVPSARGDDDDELKQFASVVLADTEKTWGQIFDGLGRRYENPIMVLYSGLVQSGCGTATAAAGPFYCPMDHKLYLDLNFFSELDQRFGAPGDFARAYVIAHEVGHHVQTLLGLTNEVQAAQGQASKRQANQISVAVELQADCYAGVWAFHADRFRDLLDPGDVDEALQAASAVGDDTIQRETQGHVVPDSFTHGSASQRTHWFRLGFEAGELKACDTFKS